MQGYLSATYVGLLYEFLRGRGLDPAAILGEPAPPPGEQGLGRFPVDRWAKLLERASRVVQEPALGLMVGSLIGPAHLGVLGYATLSCANLGAALERLRDYERLVYDVNPSSLRLEGDAAVLEWGQQWGRPGSLVDECAIAALVAYARNITATTSTSPREVRFVNAAPADRSPYETFFDCPVAFDAPTTVVTFPVVLLAAKLRQPDAALCALLDAQAQSLLERLPRRDDFELRLRNAISSALRDNDVSLAACARRLHCSARTLQRRLEQAGTTFQDALDGTRLHLAQTWLADPRLRLADVAQLLGYSEQSAFTRAFTRWTGKPPKMFR